MVRTELPDPNQQGKKRFSENIVINARTNGGYYYPSHKTPYLLIANSANAGDYFVNKQQFTVTEKQFCFLNKGDDLEITISKPLNCLMILFNANFVTGVVQNKLSSEQKLLENPEEEAKNFQIPSVPFFMNEEVGQRLTKIRNNSISASFELEEELTGLISAFLHINEFTSKQLKRINAVKSSTSEELYRRLSLARCYMYDNTNSAITVGQIAAAACMNRFHFLRTFKKVFGITPHRFLLQLKLQKAYQSLKNEKRSVSDVCYRLGFESVGSFSNLFKRHFGYPPSFLLKD